MMIFTGDDLKRLFLSKRRKIVRWGIRCAVLALLTLLFSPPQYKAWATFKQSHSRGNSSFDLKNLIRTISSGVSEGSSSTLMLSNTVLGKTAEALGLQIELKTGSERNRWLEYLRNNLLAEIGIHRKDLDHPRFSSVIYQGEIPLSLNIKRLSEYEYELYDQNQLFFKKGRIKEPLVGDQFQLTVDHFPSSIPLLKELTLIVHPLLTTTHQLRQKISIKSTREDKDLLRIQCEDPQRQRSAEIVNTLMEMYERYLIEENKMIIGAQLSYLRQRQDELGAKLDQDIQEHAQALKANLQSEGFLGIKDELQFVLEPLQAHQSRLNEIDIELGQIEQRLAKSDFEQSLSPNKSKMVQRYSTLLAEQICSAKDLLTQARQQEPMTLPSSLESLHPAVQEFNQALQNLDTSQPEAVISFKSKQKEAETLLQDVLDHLISREESLREGSKIVSSFESDLTGIRLVSAQALFDHYSKQFNELHAQMKQIIFIRDHLFDPHFEISTLSNVLPDPVTEHLVQRSSGLETELCDDVNRSLKDRLRLKNTLAIHKRFLDSHLEQTLQLSKIRIELIQEKIGSLSAVMKTVLQQEKKVLQKKIAELKQSMQALPDLWVHENRLKFKSELTKGMMEGLVHIAETKNLSDYLYQVESRPLDKATTPFSPIPPRLIVKTLIAFILASFFCAFFYLIQSLVRGIPTSLATLEALGQHTSGALSLESPLSLDSLQSQDPDTLRRIVSFLLEGGSPTTVAILGEKQTFFVPALSAFLKRHQRTSCVVDCNFGKIVLEEEKMGLFQILQGADFRPMLHPFDSYDFLAVGASSDEAVEMLKSPAFQTLIEQLSARYDYLFLLSRTPVESLETNTLLEASDCAIVLVDTSLTALQKRFDLSRQKEKQRVTFVQYPVLIES